MRHYNHITKKPWDLFVLLFFIVIYAIVLFLFCFVLIQPAKAQNAESATVKQYPTEIDAKEKRNLIKEALAERFNFSFPILPDSSGTLIASFTPADALPGLSGDEVMLASGLLIGPDSKIPFYLLNATKNFDSKLVELKSLPDDLL